MCIKRRLCQLWLKLRARAADGQKEKQADSQNEKFVFFSLTDTQGMTDQSKCREKREKRMGQEKWYVV